jgi:hypothetical protein
MRDINFIKKEKEQMRRRRREKESWVRGERVGEEK